jgi:Glycosyl hydrolases family 16
MKPFLFVLFSALAAVAQCGTTLNWTSSSCQTIAGGANIPAATVNGVLDPSAWTVISRHGEYAQNETECNIPSQISLNKALIITTAPQVYSCGDWFADGTVRTAPSNWPYVTGDVQWNTFNFQYGTLTIKGRMPDPNTSLWPTFWLLAANCQTSNKYSGDTGFGGCPNIGQSGYHEIDVVENYAGKEQFHVANPSFFSGIAGCDVTWTDWDTLVHTWQLVWNASSITLYKDGALRTVCNQAINVPMFFIVQIQTGGVGGTPNNSLLPATQALELIQVQDLNGNVIFYEDFTNSSSSSGITITLG